MHLCIFLLEARFNQFSPQKVSFEVSFRNIIRAARFCTVGGVTLCNTPLRFPPTHDDDDDDDNYYYYYFLRLSSSRHISSALSMDNGWIHALSEFFFSFHLKVK